MKTYTQIAACLTWALVTVPALAQTTAPAAGAPAPMDHSAHMAMSAPADATAGSTAEYQQANASMHKGMDIPFTGNADKDFVAGMIPHHQGAIDMARVELKYGKDPKIKKLAAGIIKAQEKEIAMMKAWQASHR